MALENDTEEDYLKALEDMIELDLKVLDVIRIIIKRNYEKGLLKNFSYNIVDFEHTITIEDINKAAKVLDIPLFEKLYMPYVTMDKKNIVVSKQPVPILYIHIKRTQQTVRLRNF